MFKITGLEKLAQDINEVQRALEEFNDDGFRVSFDPHDPASIELAIKAMEIEIDSKIGTYNENSFVAQIIDHMKEAFRACILDRAATERLRGNKLATFLMF